MKVITQIDAAGFTVRQLLQHIKEVKPQEVEEHVGHMKQVILNCLQKREPLIIEGLEGSIIPAEILAKSIITFKVQS